MLNLPPVHSYGVPQILSQWQAGQSRREEQKRYETDLGFKKQALAQSEKQFKMQSETHKAYMDNKQLMRIGAGLDNYNKRMDVAIKYFGKNKELAIPMIQDAVKIYNQISQTDIDASQITNELEAKQLRDTIADDSVTRLFQQARANPTTKNVTLFDMAKQKAYQGGIAKGTYDGLKVEVKEPKVLSPKDKAFAALSPEEQKQVTMGTVPKKDTKIKSLESLKSDYMQTMGRYWSAKRGEGQFVEDPNAQQVADEALKAAVVMAGKYKDMGGDVKDLGISEKEIEKDGGENPQEEIKMPSPVEHKGKILRDTKTKKRFRSDGKKWIEIK